MLRTPNQNADNPMQIKNHAEIVLASDIEGEKRMQQSLSDLLLHSKKRLSELRHRFKMHAPLSNASTETMKLWTYTPSTFEVVYEPESFEKLLVSMEMEADFVILDPGKDEDEWLENRIDEIRTRVLTPYPDMPNLEAPRIPSQSQTSRIPQAKPGSRIAPIVEPAPRSQATPKTYSNSTRTKSVRFSTTRRQTGRLSMFEAFNTLDDEVDRVSVFFFLLLFDI